jgi:hypothetical protein
LHTRRNPSGNEPATYSQGIEVRGGGRTLYISGQIGADEVGNLLPGIAARCGFHQLASHVEGGGHDVRELGQDDRIGEVELAQRLFNFVRARFTKAERFLQVSYQEKR